LLEKGIEKYEQFVKNLKLKIFAKSYECKSQQQIQDCFPKVNFSKMTITNIIRDADKLFGLENVEIMIQKQLQQLPKITVTDYLYVQIDDC
jgi:hypothetical protein